MSERRKRIIRTDEWAVIPVALVAGALATLNDVSPTGDSIIDRVFTGLGVAGVVWVAAAAHWWVLVLAAGVSLATVADPISTALSLVPMALGLWIGARQRSQSSWRSLSAAMTLLLLLRSEIDGFLGLSAILGIGTALVLVISGARRRSRTHRRWIAAVIGTVIGLALVGGAALVASALSVRSDLVSAVDDVRRGVYHLTDGNYEEAGSALSRAAEELDQVNTWVDSPWTQPAQLIPVLAQHRRAAVDLTGRAAQVADVISDELDVLDLEALEPVRGRIDLDALIDTRKSVDRLLAAVESLDVAIDETRSVWLAGPVADEIDELDREVSTQVTSARRAHSALTLAPEMFGIGDTRRYFVAFTTPAEARGGGGFMGSWAEIEIAKGKISLARSGRTRDLNDAGAPDRRVAGPAAFVSRYGSTGFTSGQNGTTASDIWSVINVSSDFPSTADVIAQLYPQSGGAELDGVFSMDVYALARLLEFTGPIDVEGLERPIDAGNAAEFLLSEQYLLPTSEIERVDVLEAVSRTVVERLLNGGLPGPRDLVDALAPMVTQGRLMAYATRPEEQALFDELGMSGALESPFTGDVLSVSMNNATASKLELFLDGTLDYRMTVADDGAARSTATLTLTNSAPTTGWPEGVIGNYIGLPTATNRLWVTMHSRLPVVSARVDGVDVETTSSTEDGLRVHDWVIDIAPGATLTLSVIFDGTLVLEDDPSDAIPLVLRLPALVRPMPTTIVYEGPSGNVRRAVFDRSGTFRQPVASEDFAGE